MKVPPLIQEELNASGVPFQIERGSRHFKIFIGGVFCGIFPMIGKLPNRRAELNVRSQIRRQVKKVKENGSNKINAQGSRH
jgi:hypothetical protein